MPSVDQYIFKGEQRFNEIARLYEELKSHGVPVDYWVSYKKIRLKIYKLALGGLLKLEKHVIFANKNGYYAHYRSSLCPDALIDGATMGRSPSGKLRLEIHHLSSEIYLDETDREATQ